MFPQDTNAGKRRFPVHGWTGLVLAGVFWAVNWLAGGTRTAWAFFPLWLGYALVVDGLAYRQNGSSLLMRSWKQYAGLFLLSAPGWWLFELLNLRTRNWEYLGVEPFSPLAYALLATLNFSVVMPAVFGTAEWVSGWRWVKALPPGPRIPATRKTVIGFFTAGWIMLAVMLADPLHFFPFLWLSVYFILEPVNAWMGNRTLADFTGRRDWRPVVRLWIGVLITGFFWEMWNFYSFPKWVYHVPGVDFARVFEMPLLGYTGYLPFAMELHALYFFLQGVLRRGHSRFLPVIPFT